MRVEIKRVKTARERRAFLTFPWELYRDDPCWVPPLLPERRKALDPDRGVFFQRGEADLFLALRDGKVVGTVLAGEDPPINQKRGKQACLFGFLEYVQDRAVFRALVETAEAWGQSRGLEMLYGPWNLDYEDGYGVLLEGFQRRPALMCGHSRPYYRAFMERAGFVPARPENVALEIDLRPSAQFQRLDRLADKVRERTGIRIREADFDRWQEEIDRVHGLLNRSLSHLDDHIGWRRDNLESTLEPFRRIADPALILFAEAEGETVGFLPGLPDLNEILTDVNGLRYPWNYLQLAWLSRRREIQRMTVKSVLVLPEYWNTGAAVLLFQALIHRAQSKGYRSTDLSITSIDNPSSVLTAEKLGAEIYKRWQVYQRPMG